MRADHARVPVVVGAIVGVVASILGVVVGAGCGASFLPASVVINQRVIAVVAEPPESTPGAQVTLTPAVVAPSGTLESVDVDPQNGFTATWWRCPDSDSDALGDFDQCTVPAERKNIATGVPYVDDVPTDIFGVLPPPGTQPSNADPLPADKILGAVLGYWRVVGLTMQTGARHVDAFKRIPIYLPGHLADVDPRLAALDSHVAEDGHDLGPNINPVISAVEIHEDTVDGGTTHALAANKTFFFVPIYDPRALQDYVSLKVNLDGLDLSDPQSIKDIPVDDMIKRFSKVQRCEIPTFSWFVTAGRLDRDTTLDENVLKEVYDARGVDCPPIEGDPRTPAAQYTPPTGGDDDKVPAGGKAHGWVVMRDGRGGTAVTTFDFTITQ